MTTPEINVPDSIRPYLNEIAERLWSGRSAVMVGAGFSKNAWVGFPDWSQLGDLFYQKAYGVKPKSSDQKYQNVLRLAEEVQAAIGRPALESLLRSSIPDLNVEPSGLHVTLLGLPWADVFTTNYDTLLERASAEVVNRRYEPVINKDDISYAAQPRIIKLHGSFPSERPFIITEEDYRRYPYDFAPFVNTVQQSLLENTFCLIGFSGDDPNFLQWLGWIRDNFGQEKTQKIYLVGVFNLSSARLQLLSQRGITIVDLSCCDGIGKKDHYKALNYFFEFIYSNKPNMLGWPCKTKHRHPDENADKIEEIKKVTEYWQKQRKSYPGWLILPEENRESLWWNTKNWTDFFPDLDTPLHGLEIQYLYEIIWRLDRCLLPVFEGIVECCERVLENYWPFEGSNPYGDCEISRESSEYYNLEWPEIRSSWLAISLSVLRSYREDGHIEKWKKLDSTLQNLKNYLSPEQREYLIYESYLFSLFTLNIADAKNKLNVWKPNESLPLWVAKRAAMLAEIGDLNEAETILKSTLENVRKKLNSNVNSQELTLLSLESYLMRISNSVRRAVTLRNGDWEADNVEREQFNERWNELKAFKCDPWGETKAFKLSTKGTSQTRKPVTIHREFEIGRVRQSFNFGIDDSERLAAYSFLRFSEEVGLPFIIGNVGTTTGSAEASLTIISDGSSFWATATLVRLGDKKLAGRVFNRESIHKYTVRESDEIVTNYLNVIRDCRDDINQYNRFENISFGFRLAKILPEIISRLCCKCSLSIKYQIFEFITFTYNSSHRENYEGIKELTERLIQSMSDHEQYSFIPKLLEISFPEKLNAITEREYLNPLLFINITKKPNSSDSLSVNKELVSNLVSQVESNTPNNREWALFSLMKMYDLGILDDESISSFNKAIWSKTDDFGLPENTGFYKFAFLRIPPPDEIDPILNFKKYIKGQELPGRKDKSFTMTGGDIPVLQEILGSNSQDKDLWSKDEISELLKRLLAWWDTDKEMLKGEKERYSPFGSTLDEFRARFKKLLNVVAEVIGPKLVAESPGEIKDSLYRIIQETKDYGLPNLETEISCLHIFPERSDDILNRLNEAVISSDERVRNDALKAIEKVLSEVNNKAVPSLRSEAENILRQYINWSPIKNIVLALWITIRILREHSDQFSDNLELSTLKRLKQLLIDTAYDDGHEELNFDEKLEIRKYSSMLAAELYVYFDARDEVIPEVLMRWKESCTAPDEFAEIQIPWLNSSAV